MTVKDTPLLKNIDAGFRLYDRRLDQTLSDQEFWNNVNHTAETLSSKGYEHGSRVLIGLPEPIKVLEHLFACWISGYCAVLISPSFPPEEVQRTLDFVGAQAAFLKDGDRLASADKHQKARPMAGDEPALILMTSGTTGTPKGVTLTLSALENRIIANLKHIGTDHLRTSLNILPLSFGHGLIGNSLTPLYAGADLNFLVKPEMSEMARFGVSLDEWGIQFMSSVPAFWRMVLRLSEPPKTPLQRVHIGSAPLSMDLWTKVANWAGTEKVFNTYGMTETSNWMAGGALNEPEAVEGYVGRAWGGQVKVLKEGALRSSGRGEVAVKNDALMTEYWAQPDKTQDVFHSDYFLTGDIGELDDTGALTLVGRVKNEINVGGIKVLAEEIDALLERHPEIEEACGFGIPDPISGEAVSAAIVTKTGRMPDDLVGWCRARARPEAVPREISLVTELARNERGKIDRNAVRAGSEGSHHG